MTQSNNDLEEGTKLILDFDKISKVAACGQSLLPVVVQDVATSRVLLVAHANREAVDYSLKNKVAAFWSTSRNELWIKGATSGERLDLKEIRVNCEQNSLLYLVSISAKGACHTSDDKGVPRYSCYYRRLTESGDLEFVTD